MHKSKSPFQADHFDTRPTLSTWDSTITLRVAGMYVTIIIPCYPASLMVKARVATNADVKWSADIAIRVGRLHNGPMLRLAAAGTADRRR